MDDPFPGIDERPELYQLMLLRCPDGREVRIIRDIAAENNNLGLALRFGAPVLAAIQQGANFQPEPACREILRRWLQGSGRQPVTWKTLIKALNEVYPELGKDLSAAFKTASPSENKNGSGSQGGSTNPAAPTGTDVPDSGETLQEPASPPQPAPLTTQTRAPTVESTVFPKKHEIKTEELERKEDEDSWVRKVEALLMVVNENELRAVIGCMEFVSGREKFIQVNRNHVIFLIGMYGRFVSAVVQTSPGGSGYDGAERKTERAIEAVKPSIVISVGVAFGKDEKSQQLGDVIVAEMVNDYTYQRRGKDGDVRIRNPQPPVSPRLYGIFKNDLGWSLKRAPDEVCNVITGPIISGPNLVDNLEEKKKLFKHFPDAKGGEMEGAAILSACETGSKPDGIIIKAICDWGDGNKRKDWQPFAAHAAASYVLHHLKQRGTYEEFITK